MCSRQAFIISMFIALFLFSGCTARQLQYHVNVDSISSDVAPLKKSYVLLPGTKETTADDLQFKEFATYIRRALAAKGFIPANDIEKADIAIFLVYGIGNPQKNIYSYSLPMWGQTGVSSSTTYGSVNTYGNYGTYSETTTYTPQYGITGYTSHVDSYTTYFRYILLDAYDLEVYRKENKLSQVWRTTVTSTGSSGDLRRVFPVLVAGSEEYIGVTTGQKILVVLHEEDPVVLEIRGMTQQQLKSK